MLSIGIIGLPNVGKSTLFNALIKGRKAEAKNYPFCTIEPNVGMVEVPDERLSKIASISNSKKTIPTAIEFVDIAGLVAGASKGAGLGNKFLSHIREVDAIVQVVRLFEDKDIHHVSGRIDMKDDIEIINTELILADLDTIEKRLSQTKRTAKNTSDKEAKIELSLLEKFKEALGNGKLTRTINITPEEEKVANGLHLLTRKPMIFAVNCDEENLSKEISFKGIGEEDDIFIKISAKLEQELIDLSDKEAKEYLNELGIGQTGLDKLITASYKILDLITFITSGEPETRAWTIKKNTTAQFAAGAIHTDFIKGFIKAEVADYKDFIEYNGWAGLKEKGKVRLEGKDYIVQDGDICFFHVKT